MTTKPTAAKKAAPASAAKPAAKPTAKPAAKSRTPAAAPAQKRPAAKAAPVKAATPAKSAKTPAKAPAAAEKAKKPKLVRDSFTMPEAEYAVFAQVKKACVAAGFEIKKSELLRIGVALIAKLDPKKLQAAQKALAPLKAGRPKKK